MGEERINTARFSEVTQIDHLTREQENAVVMLREFAEQQNVSVYAVAALCQRNAVMLERMESARAWSKLSPASREVIIAEIKERLDPHAPELVCVWSHWADANNLKLAYAKPEEGFVVDVEFVAKQTRTHAKLTAPALALVPERAFRSPPPPFVGKTGEAVLTAYAQLYECSVATVARWCEMKTNDQGYLYGASTMPDRESDRGLQVAGIIFEACMPVSPEAVASRIRRANKGDKP